MEKQYETHVLNNCFPTAIFAISILKPFPFPQNQSKEEMNWRNKNSSSSSSSQSGLASISQALFPISWLSKFKQITRKSNSSPAKTKRKSIPNSPLNPSLPPNTPKQCKITPTVSNSVIHDTQDKLEFEFPFSSCRSYRSCARKVTTKDDPKFRDMVSDLKQMRILTDKEGEESKENALETPRRRMKKVRKATSRKSTERDERILKELVEKNILYLQAIEAIRTPENDLEARKSKYISSSSVEKDRSGTKQLNEVKTSNSEKQRKSVYVSREQQQQQQHKKRVKQSCKVKVCSPRTASKMEICKIKALEEMKKAKARKKTRIVEERKPLESFAVVKSSLDPEKDFRDSMVEMIKENMISKAKELEDLLACYLSLNSNEYHDLIVKVFQEVWIDMYQVCSGSELQKDENRICDY